jgi:hypothetical protein
MSGRVSYRWCVATSQLRDRSELIYVFERLRTEVVWPYGHGDEPVTRFADDQRRLAGG